MEIREIRVGNYYQWYADGKYYNYQIEAKDFANDNYKNFEPIKLTEEWLVKFGFNFGGIWIEPMGLMSYGRILQHKGMGAKSTAFYINEQFIANIQYLHELQNLYFALTGTELETK